MPDPTPAAVDVLLVDEAEGEHAVPSEHRYRTAWRVAMDTDLATAFDVLATTSPLPQPGESYRRHTFDASGYAPGDIIDEFAVVVLRTARRDPENPYWWVVQVSYEGATDPTAEPPEVEYQDSPYQEYTPQDIHGGAFANSAIDPFDGGIPVDRGRFSFVIVRNVPYDAWNPQLAQLYRHTLNLKPYRHGSLTDEFNEPLEAAPGTAKVTSLTARRMTRSKGPSPLSAKYYWQVRAQIDFDDSEYGLPGGGREAIRWRHVVLDAGYRKIVDGNRVQIFTTGTKPTQPPLLDGKGLPLPAAPTGTIELPAPVPSGQVPAPQNGTYTVAGGGVLTIAAPGLMAFAPGAATVELNSAFSPTRGSVSISPDGAFVYTPAPGDPGWDSFGVYAFGELPETAAQFSVRVLIGPRPVFLAFDRYETADWDGIAQWLGDW